MKKSTMTPLRAGLLLPIAVWLAFVALPFIYMLATHDGPESFRQCMERVYSEVVSIYTGLPVTAATAVSP